VETYLGVPGLHVDGGGSYFLPRAVGIHKACELLFTGRSVDAREAERLGMVNRVLPEAQLVSAVNDLAREIASKAPVALGLTKIALWKGIETDLRTSLDFETRGMTLTSLNEDSKEGAKSFIEKRKPIFTGKWLE
jgi:2-(1,2-epoxy-1,2-dihydrophenyl)acetyl-CoA isomerase